MYRVVEHLPITGRVQAGFRLTNEFVDAVIRGSRELTAWIRCHARSLRGILGTHAGEAQEMVMLCVQERILGLRECL